MNTQNANGNTSRDKFTIKSDQNKSFCLIIENKNSTIYMNASSLNYEITKKEFEKDFSLKDLKENKYLSLFDSVNEIYEEIVNIIKSKLEEVKVKEDKNVLILNIPIGGFKIKEILLNLYEKEKDEKEQINELYNIVYNLKQENNDLKNNQSKLEERIKHLESFINDINSWKEYKEKIDKKEKEKNENKKIRNLDSLVIGNNEKYNMTLKNWINPNLKMKAELLYRLSRDGNEYQTFHNLCDNKGATLTIFKLNDGNIMGGYTTKDWNSHSSGIWIQDQNAFLFSLTENVKCIISNNSSYNAIFCYHGYGPYFEAIRFYSKKMDEPYIYPSNYYNETNKLYPGKSNNYYKAQEVEIYKLIIN